jgi:hypothetical protein
VVKRTLVVEGGGNNNQALQAELRRAFQSLQAKADVPKKYGVVAAGGRQRAYEKACQIAMEASAEDRIVLLVDAEAVFKPPDTEDVDDANEKVRLTAAARWDHVGARDGDHWGRPEGSPEVRLHFMAVNMETWLLADPPCLQAVVGDRFNGDRIPRWPSLEAVPKDAVMRAIEAATGGYQKGAHSFKALEKVNVRVLRDLCPEADALFAALLR